MDLEKNDLDLELESSSCSSLSTNIKKATSIKLSKFKRLRQKFHLSHHTTTSVPKNSQKIFDYDKSLKDYIEKHQNRDLYFQNEELNNKIDLEIRILDGILKLLNAICLSPVTNSTLHSSVNHTSINPLNSISNSSTSLSSVLINNFEPAKYNEIKCTELGAAIAAAIISNKTNESISNSSTTVTTTTTDTDTDSTQQTTMSAENNQIFQILNACKCLFVSHRKIAIYLENLNEIERAHDEENTENEENVNVDDLNNQVEENHDGSIENSGETCKLILSDLRVPLSWKWNEFKLASKNSENVGTKFATFALIYLGNMIYDTQLTSNIDATMTDISFSESFVFDDVKQSKFEIIIEFYSYELVNAANTVLQSARKLAKQFAEFASFKRNSQQNGAASQVNGNHSQTSQFSLFNSTSSYPQSIHKFKLVARASLNQDDLDEQIKTKCLKLVNDSILDQHQSSIAMASNSNVNGSLQNQFNASVLNKLPLFDYYSCRLRVLPTSSFI
jgi:hypothetical protein